MPRPPSPTDLTEAQWRRLQPLIPPAQPGGRRRPVNMREPLDASCYHLRGGASWRMRPPALPPWGTVRSYYRRGRLAGTWPRREAALPRQVRRAAGRAPTPRAALLASQSVQPAGTGGPRGDDAGERAPGRERHLRADTRGLLAAAVVHAADVRDRDGAKRVLAKARERCPRLPRPWAGGNDAGQVVDGVQERYGGVLASVTRPAEAKRFPRRPKRWLVERTVAWLGRYRRPSTDHEATTASRAAWITSAMLPRLVRRLEPG